MADQKITQLPAASLPLAGTELVPVVQGGITESVPASELGKVAGAIDLSSTNPSTPPAGTVRLFRREIAGRQVPAFVGPSGLDMMVQPHFARNKTGRYTAAGNSSSIANDSLPGLNSQGTLTGRYHQTTSLFARVRRVGVVSAVTAGSIAAMRSSEGQFNTGSGADGLGGFFMVMRFGLAAITADTRAFFGMRVSASPTNVEPSTLNQLIGIGRGAADTNFKLFYGGSSAQVPIDLGANFPANTSNVDLYDLALFAPPTLSGTINWQVTRLNTGDVAQGQLTGTSVELPTTAWLTALTAWITNNATAAAVAFDFVSLYIETDY